MTTIFPEHYAQNFIRNPRFRRRVAIGLAERLGIDLGQANMLLIFNNLEAWFRMVRRLNQKYADWFDEEYSSTPPHKRPEFNSPFFHSHDVVECESKWRMKVVGACEAHVVTEKS